MFCIHCGQPIVENAKFCAHCGQPLSQAAPVPANNEWEYAFIRSKWEGGYGEKFYLTFGKTEYDVRLDLWGREQNSEMPDVQDFLEKGWEPIGEVGPANYHFYRNKDSNGLTWLSVHTFLVEFRRPARPRTEMEKQLLGSWQETHDPNKGVFRKFGNAVFNQKLTVDRARIEFYKNRKFQDFDRAGKPDRDGIFFTNEEGEIELMYRFEDELDGKLTMTGNRFVLQRDKKSSYVRRKEYERITGE